MTAIRIEVDDRKVRAWLGRLERVASDLTPAMRAIGHTLRESAALRFEAGRGPDGKAWAPLSAATLRRRKQRGRGAQPLLDNGRLRDTLTFRADRNSVTIGSNLIYAAVQQLGARKGAFGSTRHGAPIPWGNIPPRPYLGVSASDREDVIDVLRDAITREVGR